MILAYMRPCPHHLQISFSENDLARGRPICNLLHSGCAIKGSCGVTTATQRITRAATGMTSDTGRFALGHFMHTSVSQLLLPDSLAGREAGQDKTMAVLFGLVFIF
eukprot:TRINITY_DN167369_c0_g1_i1.p1 TRINITY_DN167369_c0_g1~~TRINITY_DN167369_c0_g1_i1.p1  ORF type:complete len:106 (-),score=6.48 TRINITY_DN167369_c0_g1_i1:57-374(-)